MVMEVINKLHKISVESIYLVILNEVKNLVVFPSDFTFHSE